MVPFGEIIFLLDGIRRITALDEIINFGLQELGANSEDPAMLELMMELASREKKKLTEELEEEIRVLKARHQPSVR